MRIAAIPTMYAGVQFRSRLEARWAAFFDIVGLKWDYEPFDLAGWIPDFKVHGFPLLRRAALVGSGDMAPGALLPCSCNVLVEVKPVDRCVGDIAIEGTADQEVIADQRRKIGRSHDADIVVLGLQPVPTAGSVFEYHLTEAGYVSGCSGVAALNDSFMRREADEPHRRWGQSFWMVPWALSAGELERGDGDADNGVSRMRATWAVAGNAVQYKAPR